MTLQDSFTALFNSHNKLTMTLVDAETKKIALKSALEQISGEVRMATKLDQPKFTQADLDASLAAQPDVVKAQKEYDEVCKTSVATKLQLEQCRFELDCLKEIVKVGHYGHPVPTIIPDQTGDFQAPLKVTC
jgi:hypothetical protein